MATSNLDLSINTHARDETSGTLVDVSPTLETPSSLGGIPPAASPALQIPDQSVIPPLHPFRTLVLCFDGTGDQFDADNSNIVQLFSMLKKDNRDVQMCYYQAGIGTYTSPQVATPMMAKISKTLDEMVAWNLDAHVMDGYEFLMQNYKAGDRICIFGFSRGAYTARALAGMIHKVGLLPACNHQQVPFAYKMFTRADELGWQQSNAFKKAFSVDVDIEFIGVWDTVNSVGLIPRRLPFTTSNKIVRTFRHAVALDERRSKFKANLWNRPSKKEENLGVDEHHHKKGGCDNKVHHKLKALERKYTKDHSVQTDIEEVWFAGCHCDVGGGSVPNETAHSLARIPLRWMIRECFKTNSGIMFDIEGLKSIGFNPDCLFPEVTARPPPRPVNALRIDSIPSSPPDPPANVHTEEDHELYDALSPVYDQLSLAPFWWILELWPVKQRYQNSSNTWETPYGFNLGRGRFIPKQKRGVKIHRSVKMRMDALHADGSRYVPKASFEKALAKDTLQWVD